MEPNNGSLHTKMQPQISPHEGNPSSPGRVSSSSASSSASSFDPFQDVDDDENDIFYTSSPKYEQDIPASPISVVKSAAEWSMISASPIAGPCSPHTPDWSIHGASPTQSPPIQTMGRPGPDYDPNRIPTSVFSSKPANPTDWSMVSNDSLFSLHMRDSSFKSGELATVMEGAGENHGRSDSVWDEDLTGKQVEDEKTKAVVTMAKTEDLRKESVARTERVGFSFRSAKLSNELPPVDGARTCASTPRLSVESGNSSRSFAFPVLTTEGGRSDSVRLADILRSKPPETPQPQSQPQAQEASPKPAETRWFSCFSCCPHCC